MTTCLVPYINGVIYSQLKEEKRWDKYYTEQPFIRLLKFVDMPSDSGVLFRGFGGTGSLIRPQKPVLAGYIRPEGVNFRLLADFRRTAA